MIGLVDCLSEANVCPWLNRPAAARALVDPSHLILENRGIDEPRGIVQSEKERSCPLAYNILMSQIVRHLLFALVLACHAAVTLCGPCLHALPGSSHELGAELEVAPHRRADSIAPRCRGQLPDLPVRGTGSIAGRIINGDIDPTDRRVGGTRSPCLEHPIPSTSLEPARSTAIRYDLVVIDTRLRVSIPGCRSARRSVVMASFKSAKARELDAGNARAWQTAGYRIAAIGSWSPRLRGIARSAGAVDSLA